MIDAKYPPDGGIDPLDIADPARVASADDGWLPQATLRFRKIDGRLILQQLHIGFVPSEPIEGLPGTVAETVMIWRNVPLAGEP